MIELAKLDEKIKIYFLENLIIKLDLIIKLNILNLKPKKNNYKLKYICNKNLNGINFENEEILKRNIIDLFLGEFSIIKSSTKNRS